MGYLIITIINRVMVAALTLLLFGCSGKTETPYYGGTTRTVVVKKIRLNTKSETINQGGEDFLTDANGEGWGLVLSLDNNGNKYGPLWVKQVDKDLWDNIQDGNIIEISGNSELHSSGSYIWPTTKNSQK